MFFPEPVNSSLDVLVTYTVLCPLYSSAADPLPSELFDDQSSFISASYLSPWGDLEFFFLSEQVFSKFLSLLIAPTFPLLCTI